MDFIALEPQLISLNIDNAYTVLHSKYAKDDAYVQEGYGRQTEVKIPIKKINHSTKVLELHFCT